MTRPLEPGARLDRYSGGAIAFHWVIALLVLGNIAGALISKDWEGAARGAVMGVHKATGFTILILSFGRIVWRLAHRPPPFPDSVGRLERIGARTAHALFYLLMIAMPLTGWLMISAATPRRPFHWYGLFDLPYLPVQGNKVLGGLGHEGHEVLGWMFLGLIALHVAGALRHHFGDHPGFISRMLPGRSAVSR